MQLDDAMRLEALEAENAKLKKPLAESMPDVEALRAPGATGKLLTPSGKREAVATMRKATMISARRACRLVGLSRTVLGYEPKADPSNAVSEGRLVETAHERRRFGHRRLHALVRRERVQVNYRQVWRLYQKAGLAGVNGAAGAADGTDSGVVDGLRDGCS